MPRWRVYLDANALISFVENDHDTVVRVFEMVKPGLAELFTSELTLSEVLVGPLRQGDDALVATYDEFLVSDETLTVVPITRDILREAAELRAAIGNKTPDAIHVATAVARNCNVIVSSDERLRVPASAKRISANDVGDMDQWP
ncbi:type II toxin-antitoxin system VapC family toxin [Jiella sonneratiae]|uniref:Type II toxin-antitoxin system VapC family toxin n=1 Tax=Jiella sonneratiae TaxID=2816856 RepID=A0ABS3J7X1_9HYPH|nr:type II toxin-antitoxin system VapC family toxin [Jiella sonneratiae]MBO0905759.1 type II toxin-antitoxin system VapC family toxin [Jiella sonneratiae]